MRMIDWLGVLSGGLISLVYNATIILSNNEFFTGGYRWGYAVTSFLTGALLVLASLTLSRILQRALQKEPQFKARR